ncbi:MAG: hypothetical protein ONB50_19735 [candidate division KSB1 bacterium]|nr:hypothetical protein [candidate division KSB1 bacterium]MDZ7355576.1 hypothetical protein [candidate division KSB1 bacterium]
MRFTRAARPRGEQDLIKEVRHVLSLTCRNPLFAVAAGRLGMRSEWCHRCWRSVAPVPHPAKFLVAERQRLLEAQHYSKSSFEMIEKAFEYTGNRHPCQVFFW